MKTRLVNAFLYISLFMVMFAVVIVVTCAVSLVAVYCASWLNMATR